MKHSEFDKIYEEMLKEEADIMLKKGRDYTRNSPDKLANFKRIAETIDITVAQVIFIFMQKHYDALISYIKGNKLKGESIESKILDIRNYLALLRACIEEEKNES